MFWVGKNTSVLQLIYPYLSHFILNTGEKLSKQERGEKCVIFSSRFVYYLCKVDNSEDTGKKSRKRLFQGACTLSILELKNTYGLNFPKIYGLRRGFLLNSNSLKRID